MASLSTIDYWNTAFETANLTKIHGEHTFEAIRTLKREIIINAQSVHSALGGDSRRYNAAYGKYIQGTTQGMPSGFSGIPSSGAGTEIADWFF